jgi:hypothetical protein
VPEISPLPTSKIGEFETGQEKNTDPRTDRKPAKCHLPGTKAPEIEIEEAETHTLDERA